MSRRRATRRAELPGLVVAALAQARGASGTGRTSDRPNRAARRRRRRRWRRRTRREIERVVELERGHQPVPRRPRSRPRRARRRRAAASSGRCRRPCRRGDRQGAAAQRGTRAAKRSRQCGADAAAAPAAADARTGSGPRERDRRAERIGARRRPARRKHRLNILPRHGVERSQQGARRRSGGGARRARPPRAPRRAALAARRDRAPSASSGSRRFALEPRRIVEWWAGPAAATSRCAPRIRVPSASRSSRTRRGRRAGGPASDARGGRSARPGRSSSRRRASDAEIGRAQLVWANMALHLVVDPPALFARWHRAARSRRRRRLLVPRPRNAARAARALPRERLADADAGLHRHARPRRHARRCRLRRSGARPGDDHAALEERRGAARRAAPARRQHRAPTRHPALRTPAWRRSPARRARRARRCRRQHRLGVEVAYGHGFKPRAAPARRRAGRGVPRRNAGDGARAAAVEPRRCAKICRFVEGDPAFRHDCGRGGRGSGDSADHRRQQDVISQRSGLPRATVASRGVAALRQPGWRGRRVRAVAAAAQLLDDADPAGRLLSLALRLVARDRRRVLVARRDPGDAVREPRDARRSAPRSSSMPAMPATASA